MARLAGGKSRTNLLKLRSSGELEDEQERACKYGATPDSEGKVTKQTHKESERAVDRGYAEGECKSEWILAAGH